MSVILGVDTGGTYTDSVLIDTAKRTVVCKAKSFTTREELLKGILASVKKLNWEQPEEITLVCLSTTLATNAVVEGKGGRTGLIYLGRRMRETELPADLVFQASGQLDIKGREIEHIRPEQIRAYLKEMDGKIDALAISGFASVRNPAHELQIKQIAKEILSVPVVCAHELSSSLGYRERTVTAILNAALIPNITHLIEATHDALQVLRIEAPCMVVCGDGSLMLDTAAMDRPIETVLSGPAASVVGGRFLTGIQDALIVDVGGTTTDIANVAGGRVRITSAGATVGGWKTQLKAAEISTHGIGGDSWIQYDKFGSLQISSERVIPLAVAGLENPDLIQEWAQYHPPREHEIFFGEVVDCYRLGAVPEHPDYDENKLAGLLADGPHSRFYLSEQMGRDYDKMDFSEYVRRGLLQRCSLTPTDLLCASAFFAGNASSDEKTGVRDIAGKQSDTSGQMVREDGILPAGNPAVAAEAVRIMAYRAAEGKAVFLEKCFHIVTERIRIACLQSTADFENSRFDFSDPLVHFILQTEHPLLNVSLSLKKPLIAIGAPVKAWLPPVAEQLGTKLIIPEHAEVANAIGAAVGEVAAAVEILIRPDQYHRGFLVHAPAETMECDTLEAAERRAEEAARAYVIQRIRESGGNKMTVSVMKKPVYTEIFGTEQKTFIEEKVTATAIASPGWEEEE